MPNKKSNPKNTSMEAHTTQKNSSTNVNQPKSSTTNSKSNTNVENAKGLPDSQTIDE